MRSVDVAETSGTLADYAREAVGEPLVVTRGGKPVAAVVPLEGVDLETVKLSTDPDFIAMIEESRASYRAHGGLTLDEVRRKYGIEEEPRPSSRRKVSTRRRPSAARQSRRAPRSLRQSG